MTIDITSFFFNSSIVDATATPAWCTSIGQNKSKNCKIEDEKAGVIELLTGMLYRSVADKSRIDLTAGSQNREILLCSLFDKVFVNNQLIENQSFILSLVRERTQSHDGRLLVSYPPYALMDKFSINQNTIDAMRKSIGCSPNGCWFVHDISIKNQDELHFSAIIVDKDKPKIYSGQSKQRSEEWGNMVDYQRKYSLEKLGEILRDMYYTSESGKQKAMIYIFAFKYGEHMVDIYKPAEVITASGLPLSYKTELNEAYIIYRYSRKNRYILPGQQKNHTNTSSIQKIYYGSPGTGKSYKVEHDKLEGVNEDFIFRTTFHPDSDYSSFVGAYKPLKVDGGITYDFEPQAFTNAYVKAWQNPAEQVYLVIEEINRGNCAQIFGDLFQLLDRKNGVSEYPVNADAALAKYLKETLKEDAAEGIANGKLKIPANLNIIATMNTSDQSLFPMDSAFKRRWDWVYIPTAPPADKEKNMILHIGENNKDFDGKNIAVGDYEYKWTEFLKAINERISAVTHSDDKQLGFWFVKTLEGHDEISVSTFVSKVIFYLWNDVFKDMGPKGDNPFTIKVDGKNKVMTFNAFFDVNSEGKIVENIGVLHTFMRNLGLDPKLNKEIEAAQQEADLQDETAPQ